MNTLNKFLAYNFGYLIFNHNCFVTNNAKAGLKNSGPALKYRYVSVTRYFRSPQKNPKQMYIV